ncbi:MAG: hypothetical protein PHN90_00705 [Methanothrix sp.]|jgi:hypothetical protein|nr:hypothetical protein [Methanothrix sp.]OPX80303.1 MAG: hypothetical protein A4E50_01640 [Methanosaeta sp. PtaB.Bin087]OPY51326.1 MAG: hypothetical protein A4E51_01553 [Methanosaeta sp. PtaU1.Bin055]NLX40175.1 hypothetical protein [Methanothrix sp.]HOI70164.1 hypothetical protein [Methanothrix sp.]
MRIILTVLIVTMLLVGMVAAAKTPIDLSTLGKKSEIKASMTPVVISYAREVPTATTDAVDVRSLSRSFGTFPGTGSVDPMELRASTPITVTPSFSISMSNRTLSRTTVYTPPFSISDSNRTLSGVSVYTPPIAIFGGA